MFPGLIPGRVGGCGWGCLRASGDCLTHFSPQMGALHLGSFPANTGAPAAVPRLLGAAVLGVSTVAGAEGPRDASCTARCLSNCVRPQQFLLLLDQLPRAFRKNPFLSRGPSFFLGHPKLIPHMLFPLPGVPFHTYTHVHTHTHVCTHPHTCT